MTERSDSGSYLEPGEFTRDTHYLTTRTDGRDGRPVEAGRYRLIATRAAVALRLRLPAQLPA